MGSKYLTNLDQVLRSAGLKVIEVDGWETRARGTGGYRDVGPECVIMHHTASGPSWGNLVQSPTGQTIPRDVLYMTYQISYAPLANLYIHRNGNVYVMAAGGSNTNGTGGPWHNIPANGANSRAIGIEMGNTGVGEVYPEAQQNAALAAVAALCNAYGIAPNPYVFAHYEWTTRKIDPYGPSDWNNYVNTYWDMNKFRYDVELLANQPKEEDMQALDKQIRWFDTRSWPFGDPLKKGVAVNMPIPGELVGVSELFVNITAVDPDNKGNVAAWTGDTPYPGTSSLNFQKGDVIANTAWVKVKNGKVAFQANNANVHLVVDVQAVK